jgi:hypothetical protein
LPAVAASYLLTRTFNPDHELEDHPAVEVAEKNINELDGSRPPPEVAPLGEISRSLLFRD